MKPPPPPPTTTTTTATTTATMMYIESGVRYCKRDRLAPKHRYCLTISPFFGLDRRTIKPATRKFAGVPTASIVGGGSRTRSMPVRFLFSFLLFLYPVAGGLFFTVRLRLRGCVSWSDKEAANKKGHYIIEFASGWS